MTTVRNNVESWQKNPWVWLLIAIPALTVAGCMLTIYLALSNPHIMVDKGAHADTTNSSAGAGRRQ